MQTRFAANVNCCACDAQCLFLDGECDLWWEAVSEQSFIELAMYRIPLQVTQVLVLTNGASYPICPRCDTGVDREYVNYCDRCGQRLGWAAYADAKEVRAPRHKKL